MMFDEPADYDEYPPYNPAFTYPFTEWPNMGSRNFLSGFSSDLSHMNITHPSGVK